MLTPPRHGLRRICALVAVCLGLWPALAVSADGPLPTVPCVDLDRYGGRWHEIARLPNWFQRSCEQSWADYAPCDDGSIRVVNTCVKTSGRCTTIEGLAQPVPCSGNARLRVRFGGLAAFVPVSHDGNYWIIALDDDYQWAMVGTPDRRFLWILSRQPRLAREIYAELRRRARCLGFDVDRLVMDGR